VPEVVENECAGFYNLTSEEIKKMMETFPETLQEKCFLKCYGEGTEMVTFFIWLKICFFMMK